MKIPTPKLKNIQWRIGLPERKKSADYPEPSASGFRCHVCHDLKEAYLPLEFNFEALDSSSSGCAACKFLLNVLRPHADKEYHLGPSFSPGRRQDPITISVSRTDCDLRVRLDRPTYRDSIVLHVCANEDESQQAQHTIPYSIPQKNSKTKRAAKSKIQEWLAECASSHVHCRKSTSVRPSSLPTRVLEIRGPKEIRLLDTARYERTVTLPYACLSHCWGGQVPLQLKKDNLKQLLAKDIPWDAFPRTFQDAIDMTHRLGLRYLWIDSLCIIQDDLSDWREEGSKMADIYSGSYITLAALGAQDSSGAFYQNWESFSFSEETHTIGEGDASAPQCPVVVFTEPWNYSERHFPLSGRAWFLQERLLSPRVVHFAQNLVWWECSVSSQCQVDGVAALAFDKSRLSKQMDSVELKDTFTTSPTTWHDIVRIYSRGGLSFRKDKLPALQAIARMVQMKRKCAYYAGLWEDSLILDLTWKARLGLAVKSTREGQQPEYVAPSWSWASIEGAVKYGIGKPFFETSATVTSAQTTPAGDDPLGEVTAGSISLKGLCLSATIKGERYDCSDLVLECKHHQMQEMWSPDHTDWEGDRRVLLIYLGTTTSNTSTGYAYCLVLTKVGSKESIFFRRVGLFDTIDPNKWVLDLFRSNGHVQKVVIR